MIARVIEIPDLSSAERELFRIGSDKTGIQLMAPKAVSRVLKIKGVSPAAANIIKS